LLFFPRKKDKKSRPRKRGKKEKFACEKKGAEKGRFHLMGEKRGKRHTKGRGGKRRPHRGGQRGGGKKAPSPEGRLLVHRERKDHLWEEKGRTLVRLWKK